MQAYRLRPGAGIDSLECVAVPSPEPGPRQVKLAIKAVALNYRDLMIARGEAGHAADPVVPCSDAVGVVQATGPGVRRIKAGQRVAATFFPKWLRGSPERDSLATVFGTTVDGLLLEEVVLDEAGLVAIPEHLSDAEGAALPCAGVTAWNALFATGGLRGGQSVLLLGTGGVSISCLQLAKAAGLTALITSSSDAKLNRAATLGADHLINYRKTPEWHREVRRLTGSIGVDLVVEVGGEGTLRRSIASVRTGGTVAIVGALSGARAELEPLALVAGAKRLMGISVGSRAMFETLNRFVTANRLRPVIDRTFPFEQAKEAFRYLESAGHMGKVVITRQRGR